MVYVGNTPEGYSCTVVQKNSHPGQWRKSGGTPGNECVTVPFARDGGTKPRKNKKDEASYIVK